MASSLSREDSEEEACVWGDVWEEWEERREGRGFGRIPSGSSIDRSASISPNNAGKLLTFHMEEDDDEEEEEKAAKESGSAPSAVEECVMVIGTAVFPDTHPAASFSSLVFGGGGWVCASHSSVDRKGPPQWWWSAICTARL